jgi:acyl-CoA synthetase (AMP-forming)/AMP-acid ligase II
VGVPHEKWNEAVKAYVVGDGVSEQDLEQWCKDDEELADYQRPREYEFLDELPRSNTGKLNRSSLRES